MLYESGLLPDNGQPKHLLWACYFLKVYPKQAAGCSVVGGTSGAVDPKTMKYWVWEFIDGIGELVDDVVSTNFSIACNYIISSSSNSSLLSYYHVYTTVADSL